MGEYSDNLFKRINTWGPKEGYCAICRKYEKLTSDHVPPKNCGNVSNVIISSLTSSGSKSRRTIQGGLQYRTICSNCNNGLLGLKYDPELGDLFNEVKSLAESVSKGYLTLPSCKTFFVKPQRIARSVIGHMLAGNAVEQVKESTPHAPMYQTMVDYFLNENSSLPDEVEIYYWFYPFSDIQIVRAFGRNFGFGGSIVGDVLKFFPFAFWVTWKQPKEVKFRLGKLLPIRNLSIDDVTQLTINFDSYPESDFPEAPKKNGLTVLNSQMAVVGKK